jgi:hypothetical protein
MAFGSGRLRSASAAGDDSAPVPKLSDDIEWAAASSLLHDFSARRERLKIERDGRDLEHYLRGRDINPKSPTDVALRERLSIFLKFPPLESTPSAVPAGSKASPAIAAGLAVLGGQPLAPVRDHHSQMAAVDQQIDALDRAVREQASVLADITENLSLEYAKKLQPRFDSLNVELYRAGQHLAQAAKKMRELRAEVVRSGIVGQSTILRTPNVRGPLMLGDETHYDSEISGWRRLLEQWGLI